MAGIDKSVDLYKLLNPKGKGAGMVGGIKIVKAVTVEPDAATFIFEGTKLALGAEIFEIPYNMYPIKKGDRFLTYPIISNGAASRWALIQKINGCTVNLATMQGTNSIKIQGIEKVYTADQMCIPPYLTVSNTSSNGYLVDADVRPLQAGDVVSVAPVMDGVILKYAILQRY